uniref:F-box family protein n=1 Tax=Solanum tuberosum TaxID=4113 RepID=M1DST9_SOLTU
MLEFNLVGSCIGLLCSINDRLVLHNPFTGDYKDILKFIEFEEQQVVFRFHPFTKEYKVIKIVYYTNTYNIPSKLRNVRSVDAK